MRVQTRAENTIAWAPLTRMAALRKRIPKPSPLGCIGRFRPCRKRATWRCAVWMEVRLGGSMLLWRRKIAMKVAATVSRRTNRRLPIASVVLRAALASAATAALALGCFSAAPARAQQSPQAGAGNLDGDWLNVDPNTRGIVEIVIAGRKVHPFGACHPAACDQGVIKARSFASSVDSSDIRRLVAKEHTGFSQVEITLSLEADGRLRADRLTHFTDGSGRADYSAVDHFQRGRRPYAP